MNGIPSIQIQTTPAQLTPGKIRGELSIDQTPSRASYNIGPILDLMPDAAERGRQTALATIERFAADGDAVSDFSSGATVAQLAVAAAQPEPVMVDYVSIARPDINYSIARDPGTFTPSRVDIKI